MGALFAMTLPALVILLILLVAVDRVVLRVRGRGLHGSATSSAGSGISQVGFDHVAACFYAGKQTELAVREEQAQQRDEADAASPLKDDPKHGPERPLGRTPERPRA